MHSVEGTGKNIEQAIKNALLELKASREDVDIKILNEGGFLKKAKVLVSISPDAIEKYERKENLKKNIVEEENDDDFAKNFIEKKLGKEETKEQKKVRIIADEEISDFSEEAEEKVEEKTKLDKKFSGEEFLNKILEILNLNGTIEKNEDERFVKFNIAGEEARELIGHHGEGMLALSYLMNLICKSEDRKKIVLDIDGYRQKREESLTALAKRIANKVAKTGRYYKLEPMDASERKIIHTALQDDERVTTLSKGEEPKRYLIVFPKEYKE